MKTYFVLLGALLCLNLAQAQKIDQTRKKAQAHQDKSKKAKSSSRREEDSSQACLMAVPYIEHPATRGTALARCKPRPSCPNGEHATNVS
ncbi:MAG: hypothetical protein AAFU64_19685, partial [Bacteroidota bacterium]